MDFLRALTSALDNRKELLKAVRTAALAAAALYTFLGLMALIQWVES
jgi:hypothetical protein